MPHDGSTQPRNYVAAAEASAERKDDGSSRSQPSALTLDAPAPSAAVFPGKPQFSTLTGGLSIGDDWPAWQKHLHPVTYAVDRPIVERAQAEIARQLAWSRKCLADALKRGERRMVAAYRKEIDRLTRWERNCACQLRLIDAAEGYLSGLAVAS